MFLQCKESKKHLQESCGTVVLDVDYSSLNGRQMQKVLQKKKRPAGLRRARENAASVMRVTELDGECSNSCLSVQQWPSEPAIIITSVQKSAGCEPICQRCSVGLK